MNWNVYDLDKMYQQAAEKPALLPGKRGLIRPLSGYLRENPLNHLLAGLFLLGLLAGTLLVRQADAKTLEVLNIVLGGYIEHRQTASFLSVAASSFSALFSALVLLFICGFCAIAQPIIFGVPLFKGLGYGFSLGMLYAQYGVVAIRYSAILLFPAMFLSACLLVLASRASVLLAVALFRAAILPDQHPDPYRIKRYCAKFCMFTILCLLISLLDALLFYKLGGLIVL